MSQVTSTLVKFWDDDKTDIHAGGIRKEIPPMPKIKQNLQVVSGGFETLVYLAWQVRKSNSKSVIVRAVASAIMILFEDVTKNYTGSSRAVEKLTGLDRITDDTLADRTILLETNFEDEERVTIAEMDNLMNADTDEIGSYFGVLCLCGVKTLTGENRTSFNEKRQNAVKATTIGDPLIFIADSEFLSNQVIQKVYASFNSFLPVRTHIVATTVHRLEPSSMGPTLAFTTMFLLLVDQGMSALRIIKEAMVKHPWIRTEFPEIHAEIEAAQTGILAINKAPAKERSFLKSMHGSAFVPVTYKSIENLTGLCKFVLKETTVSYAQYGGGKVTEAQELKLVRLMTEKGLMRPATVAAVIQE